MPERLRHCRSGEIAKQPTFVMSQDIAESQTCKRLRLSSFLGLVVTAWIDGEFA